MSGERCPSCDQPSDRESATAPSACTRCLLRLGSGWRLDHLPDERLLDYVRVLNVIGEGPRARVFLGEWTTPGGGLVALKCSLHSTESVQGDARLCLLDHPSIAAIHEIGADARVGAYAISDYVPGPPITRFCEREHPTTAERVELWLQAADALAYAHVRGLPHLNLKPTNVLVVSATAHVLDFEGSLAPTRATDNRYRAPEQAAGAAPDPRSDVFALGLLLAELIANRPDAALLHAIARHATRPDPGERPGSVAALAAEVRTCLHALSDPASI